MKKFTLMKQILIIPLIATSFITSVYANGLTLFSSDVAAQQHCRKDVVVWLNLPTGIWHMRGARWYGRTKHGAYVCRAEAAAEGDRGSLNGS